MAESSSSYDTHRKRLFLGICLALIPTGASFALVSNILVPLKQQFILTNYQVGLIGGAALWGMALSLLIMGPLLEGFGLKNGARLAFAGHLAGITLMIAAVTRGGDPSAFWMLMGGAATLAAGNGMIEVTGNPLVAALFPDQKTKYLNRFHAFFPIGIVLGGIVGFALATWGGPFAYWPYQIGVIYLPILVYGALVLPRDFPKTENAQHGIPVGEMFRYTLTKPLFILMLAMMAITTSLELGPMRWVPAVLQSAGLHGILVLVWISGWMVVLRSQAGHAVERLQPTGMLLVAAILTGSGLFLLSFATSTFGAFAAATVFAWGVAFFFPTMVGVVAEKMPRTGSLGIVLTAGMGLGMAGAVGVPLLGKLADRYLAQSLPASTSEVLKQVDQQFLSYVVRAQSATDQASLGYREREVADALAATRAALAAQQQTGSINNDAASNALRAIVGTAIPNEPLVGKANDILQPAEAAAGQRSFRYVAPAALVLIFVFGVMFAGDRRRGGYRAVKIDAAAAALLLMLILYSAFARQANAQPVTTYKVGDKIECQVTGKWQPGTIVKVTQAASGMFYLVNNDGEASTWDRWASSSQIRARTGLMSETAKARNELAALGALKAPKAGSLDETFQNLIRERYEQQGSKEFPVTVTFQGLLIGKTHPYGRPDVYGESPDGPGGTAGTTVYPVNAQFYYRTAYRDAFLTYQQDDQFFCFKNAFSKWQCNLGSGRGTVKKFREERAG